MAVENSSKSQHSAHTWLLRWVKIIFSWRECSVFPLLPPLLYSMCWACLSQMYVGVGVCVCVLRWVTRNTEGGVLPVGKWWWICGPPHLRIIAPSSSGGSAVHCQILIFSYSNFIVLRVSVGDFPLCSFLGKWSNWDICPSTPQWGFFLSSSTESHLPFTALLWGRVSFQWAAFWIKVLRELMLWQSYMVQL